MYSRKNGHWISYSAYTSLDQKKERRNIKTTIISTHTQDILPQPTASHLKMILHRIPTLDKQRKNHTNPRKPTGRPSQRQRIGSIIDINPHESQSTGQVRETQRVERPIVEFCDVASDDGRGEESEGFEAVG